MFQVLVWVSLGLPGREKLPSSSYQRQIVKDQGSLSPWLFLQGMDTRNPPGMLWESL